MLNDNNSNLVVKNKIPEDLGEVIDFIVQLITRFSDQENFSNHLPDFFESVGRFLGVQRITISFNEGASCREISWLNNLASEQASLQEFYFSLKKSGQNNTLLFLDGATDPQRESLFSLMATFVDAQLAAEQMIRIEHSQRLLAESINQISKILTSTLDRDELLSLFLDQLGTLVPYDSANVMLLQNGLLYMHAARGYKEFSGPTDISQISFIPNQTFLIEEVLVGNQPVILPDTQKSPQWTWMPCGEHVRSWMGVPLLVKGNAIGLFSIDKSLPNFFTRKHAQLASALAQHAALALDNALMFSQLQTAHESLRRLSAGIIEAQEKERQKIAIELHDHTGQALLALRAELRVLGYQLLKDPDKAQAQIEYLDQIVVELNKDLEHLAYDLRPPTLSALGPVAALNQYIEEFSRRMNIQAEFIYDTDIPRLPEDIELICYRIVQEALTNIAKHASANHIDITMNFFEDTLHLVIKDNGVGFRINGNSHRRGFGLLGMRERLMRIQGRLEIQTQPGHGTELIVTIPIPPSTLISGAT
jgi:signal transduction histidine kinase